eukprot:TRINITY_DN3575_c0_g1_i1.p1 TRINITY_DN3575_c0_g1~~TRINITY_DN3575_c0_g1_i1.p1  ORF type:complete len:960 (-),score=230.68 TRINITY_DN3575_c0_g1_i1:741-3620(-)
MEAIESIDRECAALGGLFQQVVNDMKTGVPHYEDFISKAGKLHSQLKNTILALGSFLDTFQKIADAATNTKGATREIGACLTRIVIRHKAMEARMKTLSSALLDCLVLPLQEKMEEWKKVAHSLDKEHSKEYKKLRQELKKKTDNQNRLVKKHNKKSQKNGDFDPKVEQSISDVTKSVRSLHEVEKSAVRRVLIEERSRYCTFVACLKPVLGEEISMVSELQQLEEVMNKLDKHTEDPFKLPEASEQVLNDIKTTEGGVVFQTPPSSPSSLGSRKSSMCSISSAGSSSGGSTNSPSHQAQQHRHMRNHQGVGNPMAAPMRLSSISSQDSGFTSQDTLFLRPGSPTSQRAKTPNGSDQDLSGSGGSTPGAGWPGLVQGMPGPPMTDRPHTISSAYEKGHQRPTLQPYTFNPPDKTIIEEDERPVQSNNRGGSQEQLESTANRPPVPQRCVSLERPTLPGKTQAALIAKQRITEGAAQGSHLPNFSCNQPDMVVPQPVYMNMSDLANMAATRAAERQDQCEDGLDLKTPTQEDLNGLPSGSDGSSSGYGSQNAVKVEDQGFADGVTNSRGTLLRRSSSQASNKPPPPTRRTPSVISQDNYEGEPEVQGSNSTTPRGSMEFLPPPPPHLLHSDEEEEYEGQGGEQGIVSKRGLSVAESIKELQRRQTHPSPGTLRRVQSMSGPPSHHSDRTQIMARLDAALASPRGPRPVSPAVRPEQDQIYAPVAALQQKIQQQQQARLAHGNMEPGMVPHPPGPSVIPQSSGPNHPQQTPIYATSQQSSFAKSNSPEGDQYGFGMQFQMQSKTFYQHQQIPPNAPVQHPNQTNHYEGHPQYQQQQQHQHHHQQQRGHPPGQPHLYGQHGQHQGAQYQPMQPQYHDQIMSDMDPTLSQRPQPPDMHNGHRWPNTNYGQRGDPQAAMRVRHWIETRTVSDVQKVRPILNSEIHQGFLLKKANGVMDRSQPRF